MEISKDLTEDEHRHLRQKYNPDGSLLRENQMELLKMMQAFAEICKKHDIKWWLSSGTLLGAARHHGFIPWDDDVDVVMMRKDYKRLENILLTMPEETGEYVWHSMRNDAEYISIWGRLRKKDGIVHAKNCRDRWFRYHGLWLDVFSMERTNYAMARIAKVLYYEIQRPTKYITKCGAVRRFLIRFVEIFVLGGICSLLRLLLKVFYRGDEYRYTLGSGWAKHKFYEKDIFPLKTAKFEGVDFPVPNNMDAYLTNVYGDWRKLPSEDDIVAAIHCTPYIEEIEKRNHKD